MYLKKQIFLLFQNHLSFIHRLLIDLQMTLKNIFFFFAFSTLLISFVWRMRIFPVTSVVDEKIHLNISE